MFKTQSLEQGDGKSEIEFFLQKLSDTISNEDLLSCKDLMKQKHVNYGGHRRRAQFKHVCACCGKGSDDSPLLEAKDLPLGMPDGKLALSLCLC